MTSIAGQRPPHTTAPPVHRAVDQLLASYTTTHPLRSPSPLPPSSRVNPSLQQRLPPVSTSNPFFWSFRTWIAFWLFIIRKAIHIILSLASHFLFGAKRKSWGYRMTLIASAMRDVANHTSLADIILIRRLVSLHFLVPLPEADFIPVTWEVPRLRGHERSRGFFEPYDRAEDGRRELSGEWVVSAQTARRWQNDDHDISLMSTGRRPHFAHLRHTRRDTPLIAGLEDPAIIVPDSSSDEDAPGRLSPLPQQAHYRRRAARMAARTRKVIYYVHGGAYYVGNAATHRLITIGVSQECRARVYAITYRLAPEHAFPLPFHDVLHGYLRLLRSPLNISPSNIVIMGDSAGGGLSLALCMYLRDEGYEQPAGLVLMSPWVDLTMSCASWDENGEVDVVPRPEADDHLNPVACYLGAQNIGRWVTHPYASPLFGDFHGLCPMLIQSGDSEVLRDEITLLAHKASLAGVDVTHELYEDMVHVFQMFTFLPATKTALTSVGHWVRKTLPQIHARRRAAGSSTARAPVPLPQAVDEEIAEGQRRAEAAGESVTRGGIGRVQVTQDEINAVADWEAQRQGRPRGRSNPQPSSLLFDIAPPIPDWPSVDTDSLPRPATRSGSPTPVASPGSARGETFSSAVHAPPLRRALTALASSTPVSPTYSDSGYIRRRRRTQGTSSPTNSSSTISLPSGPNSPPPSVRGPRIRSDTISHTSPRTRYSQSNSDIVSLVEGYTQGGAANETTVYAPGGQVRARLHLGDLEDGE